MSPPITDRKRSALGKEAIVSTSTATSKSAQIDVRGPRFGAWITTVVLAVVLITGWWPLLALALIAALLDAAVGFCLGCEMYLLLNRTKTIVGATR